MLDIGFPCRFGVGEPGGGELVAQIVGLVLERAPIGDLAFEHSLQRRQNQPQCRNKSLRVQGAEPAFRRQAVDLRQPGTGALGPGEGNLRVVRHAENNACARASPEVYQLYQKYQARADGADLVTNGAASTR